MQAANKGSVKYIMILSGFFKNGLNAKTEINERGVSISEISPKLLFFDFKIVFAIFLKQK